MDGFTGAVDTALGEEEGFETRAEVGRTSRVTGGEVHRAGGEIEPGETARWDSRCDAFSASPASRAGESADSATRSWMCSPAAGGGSPAGASLQSWYGLHRGVGSCWSKRECGTFSSGLAVLRETAQTVSSFPRLPGGQADVGEGDGRRGGLGGAFVIVKAAAARVVVCRSPSKVRPTRYTPSRGASGGRRSSSERAQVVGLILRLGEVDGALGNGRGEIGGVGPLRRSRSCPPGDEVVVVQPGDGDLHLRDVDRVREKGAVAV